MTPREMASASEPDAIHQSLEPILDGLNRDVTRARRQVVLADALLASAVEAVVEHPERRLMVARAALDRAEEIRAQVTSRVRRSRSLTAELDLDERLLLGISAEARMSGLVARGAAAEERLALYALRNKTVLRRLADIRSSSSELVDLQRHLDAVIRSLDSHRLEALTMSRASFTYAPEEYAVVRATLPPGE